MDFDFEPQLIVGILFLVIGGMDINKKPSQRAADILNNVIVVLIFLITLVNVIINGTAAISIPPSCATEVTLDHF